MRAEGLCIIGHKNNDTVVYAHDSAVEAGEVILLDSTIGLVGVANGAYAEDEAGTYTIRGVVRLPIATGVTIAQFKECYWDVSADAVIIASPAPGDPSIGYAVADGSAAGGWVDVDLNAVTPGMLS